MAGEPSDLPPVPERRCVSPASEDYEAHTPPAPLLWPLLFYGVLAALTAVVVGIGWHAFGGH